MATTFKRGDYNFINVPYSLLRYPKFTDSANFWRGNIEFGVYIDDQEQIDKFMNDGLPVEFEQIENPGDIPRAFITMRVYANNSSSRVYIVERDTHKAKLLPAAKYGEFGKFHPQTFSFIAYPWNDNGTVRMSVKDLYAEIESNEVHKMYADFDYVDLDTGEPVDNPYLFGKN